MFRIFFLTSSRVKLSHARYLGRGYDMEILSKRQYGKAYSEPRLSDRTILLQQSFQDARRRWINSGANPASDWFFLEDTSVIIDALSEESEYPGLDVKYWMQQTDFQQLDTLLKANGNNRGASIRSDVVLYLPALFRKQTGFSEDMMIFTSHLRGSITPYEQVFDTDLLYPWLDNRSFNRWFVPDGLSLPISLLSIAQATRHDFRASITLMFKYLEKNKVLHRANKRQIKHSKSLAFEWTSSFVICGLPCSGKTTLGKFLSETYGYYHIEASDFMRMAYYELHGPKPDVPLEVFAERALRETPGIVVDRILKEVKRVGDIPLVITGFRSPQEIELLNQKYEGTIKIATYVVSAGPKTRYTRCCARDRSDKLHNYADFIQRDNLQNGMGIASISKIFKKFIIRNSSSLAAYFNQFSLRTTLPTLQIVPPHLGSLRQGRLTLEHRILLTLAKVRVLNPRALTTTEISYLINNYFPNTNVVTNKNNVSRYFNFQFHPYYKFKRKEKSVVYELSQTGYGRALSLSHGFKTLHPNQLANQLNLFSEL